jgi:hypothetical protein
LELGTVAVSTARRSHRLPVPVGQLPSQEEGVEPHDANAVVRDHVGDAPNGFWKCFQCRYDSWFMRLDRQ